jgi:hypothetical protein
MRYRLKRPSSDGTTHVLFHPIEFLEKLAAIVPAPKAHLVRYSGILAPAAKWRSLIVTKAGTLSVDVSEVDELRCTETP